MFHASGFVLALLCTLAPSIGLAHGDHDHGTLEELTKIYGVLYRHMAESFGRGGEQINPQAYFGQSHAFTNQDAVGSLIQRILEAERKHACEHHDACENGSASKEDRAYAELFAPKTDAWTRAWNSTRAAFGWIGDWGKKIASFFALTLPAITADGIKEHGFAFAAYTVITEGIEHVVFAVPVPAVCKVLQGIYFVTAGFVSDFNRIQKSKLGFESHSRRLKAAFFAVQNEIAFKYGRARNRLTINPYLEAIKHSHYDEYADQLGEELGEVRRFLLSTRLWGDVYASIENEAWGNLDSGTAPSGLQNQFEGAAELDPRVRLWRVYRLSAFLNLFVDIIRDAGLQEAEERLLQLKLTRQQYGRFLGVRLILGSTALMLNRLKAELIALVSADHPDSIEKQVRLLRFISDDVVPFIGELGTIASVHAPKEKIQAVRARIKKLLKDQKRYIKSGWTCSDGLTNPLEM